MLISQEIKNTLISILKKEFSKFSNIDFDIICPSDKNFGDYSTNIALVLAKKTKQNPHNIAKIFCKYLVSEQIFSKVEIAGVGFINFYLSERFILHTIKSKDLLSLKVGHKQTIIIDYSSPNIAKPFGVGHLRSTIIGAATYNLYKFLGYRVIGDNHLGDWGTQFGKMIYAIMNWGDEKTIKKNPIIELQKLYVRFHNESQRNPILEDEARKWFKKLEENDKTAKAIWQKCVDWSMKEFNRIYQILGVKFDLILGESFYQNKIDAVISECEKHKITKVSDGALVVFLSDLTVPAMLKKSDGATTYLARDLAAIKYRIDQFSPVKIIYHVGNEQSLHFQQLFGVAKLLGWDKNCEFIYAGHGLIRTKEGKLSTRLGQTIYLENLIDLADKNARKLLASKEKSIQDDERVKKIALGAIKYSDLSSNRKTDIVFDWKKMFALSGNSGPYLQYTYARANSVLKKANTGKLLDKIIIGESTERDILLQILKFNDTIVRAADNEAPSILAEYLYNLASDFNQFYDKFPILKSPPSIQQSRLAIVYLLSQAIKKGLNILGIEVLDKM